MTLRIKNNILKDFWTTAMSMESLSKVRSRSLIIWCSTKSLNGHKTITWWGLTEVISASHHKYTPLDSLQFTEIKNSRDIQKLKYKLRSYMRKLMKMRFWSMYIIMTAVTKKYLCFVSSYINFVILLVVSAGVMYI